MKKPSYDDALRYVELVSQDAQSIREKDEKKKEGGKITCNICDATEKLLHNGALPYRWSEVHRETADVDDSAAIYYESDIYLCSACLLVLLGHKKIKILKNKE